MEHVEHHPSGHDAGLSHGHIVPYRVFFIVWGVLLVLTTLLVVVSHMGQGLAVACLLTVTPLKAGLVLYYFMHLKYEVTLFKTMVFVALGTLIIFLGMLFSDVLYR